MFLENPAVVVGLIAMVGTRNRFLVIFGKERLMRFGRKSLIKEEKA
jgi:hypothetical protein